MLKKLFSSEIIRFLFVGVLNTLFGATLMFVLYNFFNASYWVSSACNYIFGSIMSFFLNKYFTFKSRTKDIKEAGFFILNIAVCYFLAYGVAKPIAFTAINIENVKVKENIAMVIGMCLFTLINYIGQKLVVFKKKK